MSRLPDFVIFDFETLSTNTYTAPIISMGAISGNWGEDVDEIRKRSFYRNVSALEQIEYGLRPMKSTLEWWEKQSDDAKKVLYADNKIQLKECLLEFNKWCTENLITHETIVWVRAPHFDFNIITNLYEKVFGKDEGNNIIPISHWKVRDTRTFCDIVYNTRRGYAPNRDELFSQYNIIEHNAVDDCLKEYLQLNQYFKLFYEDSDMWVRNF